MPESKTSKRLGKFTRRGWVTFTGTLLGVIGVVVTVVFSVIPLLAQPDANIAVCHEIEADELQQDVTASDARTTAEQDKWLENVRTTVARRLSEAVPGSPLAKALASESRSLDEVVVVRTDKSSTTSQSAAAILQQVASGEEVEGECATLGVRFAFWEQYKTADGSISRTNAIQYCDATLAYLHALANGTTTDPHVWDTARVVVDDSGAGLPPDVYGATLELLRVLQVGSLMREGDPAGGPASKLVEIYCVGVGAKGWPSTS